MKNITTFTSEVKYRNNAFLAAEYRLSDGSRTLVIKGVTAFHLGKRRFNGKQGMELINDYLLILSNSQQEFVLTIDDYDMFRVQVIIEAEDFTLKIDGAIAEFISGGIS